MTLFPKVSWQSVMQFKLSRLNANFTILFFPILQVLACTWRIGETVLLLNLIFSKFLMVHFLLWHVLSAQKQPSYSLPRSPVCQGPWFWLRRSRFRQLNPWSRQCSRWRSSCSCHSSPRPTQVSRDIQQGKYRKSKNSCPIVQALWRNNKNEKILLGVNLRSELRILVELTRIQDWPARKNRIQPSRKTGSDLLSITKRIR